MQSKTPTGSAVTLGRLMGPQDANSLGNVHGGVIMKMVDEAGALAAMRHSGGPVVTVSIDTMSFQKPIYVGQLVVLRAELTYAGKTSMEARVEVQAENPFQAGDITHTNLAYVVYVAIDSDGKPRTVPPLEAENEAQALRMEQAGKRQAFRKQQHEAERLAQQVSDRDAKGNPHD
ncbi:MAG: acyl-CoA thioesterase [Chloroflexi bacterium]|nr:acyl-CoA thioesterase [Chloroflexota bacterium]